MEITDNSFSVGDRIQYALDDALGTIVFLSYRESVYVLFDDNPITWFACNPNNIKRI